jgi:hypothetical protein
LWREHVSMCGTSKRLVKGHFLTGCLALHRGRDLGLATPKSRLGSPQ